MSLALTSDPIVVSNVLSLLAAAPYGNAPLPIFVSSPFIPSVVLMSGLTLDQLLRAGGRCPALMDTISSRMPLSDRTSSYLSTALLCISLRKSHGHVLTAVHVMPVAVWLRVKAALNLFFEESGQPLAIRWRHRAVQSLVLHRYFHGPHPLRKHLMSSTSPELISCLPHRL